jgi:hypothetical protein
MTKNHAEWNPELPSYENWSASRRLLHDVQHFGVSLAWELRSAVEAAPGYLFEIVRNGLYPSSMNVRKLERNQSAGNLEELKRLNPEWEFRSGYDPANMVIVFLHGYIDNTGADRVAYKLADLGYHVYLVRYPFLRDVEGLGDQLGHILEGIAHAEGYKMIVPIGHSLGGFIWDELLLTEPYVVDKYNMPLYIPLGSPHFGTLAAHIGPGRSARQMEPSSRVVERHLTRKFHPNLELYPFVSRYDILVLPIETALIKEGVNYLLSETGHVAQIIRPEIVVAIEEVLATPGDVLRERAIRRPFYHSSLLSMLSRLPAGVRRSIGIEGPLQYLSDDEGNPTEFLLRIVHHEINRSAFPQLVRPGSA